MLKGHDNREVLLVFYTLILTLGCPAWICLDWPAEVILLWLFFIAFTLVVSHSISQGTKFTGFVWHCRWWPPSRVWFAISANTWRRAALCMHPHHLAPNLVPPRPASPLSMIRMEKRSSPAKYVTGKSFLHCWGISFFYLFCFHFICVFEHQIFCVWLWVCFLFFWGEEIFFPS